VTYELVVVVGCVSIRCLLCGRASSQPRDIETLYCAHCHLFHDAVAEARRRHAEGRPHLCGEWYTADGLCAVCASEAPA
jgi:hypothetical protein